MGNYRVPDINDPMYFVIPDPTNNMLPSRTYLEISPNIPGVSILRFVSLYKNETLSIPIEVYNGFAYRVRLPDVFNAKALATDINCGKFDDLLKRICRGYSTVIEGGINRRGKLSEYAIEALQQFEKALEEYEDLNFGIAYAGDWLSDVDFIRDYGVTKDTTDDELERIAEEINSRERNDSSIVLWGTLEVLKEYRDTQCG